MHLLTDCMLLTIVAVKISLCVCVAGTYMRAAIKMGGKEINGDDHDK